jgi:hypothetical protein
LRHRNQNRWLVNIFKNVKIDVHNCISQNTCTNAILKLLNFFYFSDEKSWSATQNSTKIRRKFDENSTKIRRKFDENSTKIRRKFDENSTKIRRKSDRAIVLLQKRDIQSVISRPPSEPAKEEQKKTFSAKQSHIEKITESRHHEKVVAGMCFGKKTFLGIREEKERKKSFPIEIFCHVLCKFART